MERYGSALHFIYNIVKETNLLLSVNLHIYNDSFGLNVKLEDTLLNRFCLEIELLFVV